MVSKFPQQLAPFLLVALLSGTVSTAQAGKVVYKWSDDDGTIHYTATPPLLRGHKQINEKGLTVGETSAPLTREQRAQQQVESKAAEEKVAEITEQGKLGRLLLATYRSEADIAARLEQILDNYGGEIELAAKALDSESERLRNQVRRAANLQRRNEPINEAARKKIQQQRGAVIEQQNRIANLQNDMANERTKFAKDLARYRELNQDPSAGR